jgi:DNA-directed RNA polymerase specialized sigma24 family protein
MMDRTRSDFERFVRDVEPKLRRALVAGFGADLGRQAAADALAWSWENWDKVCSLDNPAGYLYKVGRTAASRAGGRDFPAADVPSPQTDGDVAFEPGLLPALHALSAPQRTAVLLVHGHGYTLREAAELVGVTASTIHRDCDRALTELRAHLEVEDVH